ncbi:MAG: PEP-CTERM sorting domain-containing protein [Paucibacter sp.]|nr:PEP-CTERM sorting domain-containing protein [Roseateles sp.]
MKTLSLTILGLSALALLPAAQAAAPSYTIVDLGVIGSGTASQAFGASPDGGIVVGRSFASQTQIAYSWTSQGGMVALPNLAGRKYATANDVNSAGLAVGTSAVTSFGSAPLPVMWSNGAVSALAMPQGFTSGSANGVNAAGVIAGTVGSGSVQRAVLFSAGGSSLITATAANGSLMTSAFGINDAGLVVGIGIDPNNAAVNVGMVYDSVTGVMSTVGALAGANAAINFAVSNSGYVVGTSSINQGSGNPFIWSASTGMVAIGLPEATSQGSARGVNDQGWVVGNAGGQYSVPFLYADGATYSLQSLLSAGSGWDLSTNTSASAMSIANNGSIVGTVVHNGQTHAYQMTLVSSVPEPESWALMLGGLSVLGGLARRRRQAILG